MLAKKYAPKTFDSLLMNRSQALKVLELVKNGRNVIIEGKTGTGKTTIVNLVAKELNYQIVDVPSIRTVERAVETGKQAPMFYSGKIIVFDDYETFRNRKWLKKVSEESKYPVVVTTSSIFSSGLYALSGFEKIKLKAIRKDILFNYLKKIAAAEGIGASDRDLMIISDMSSGDVRAALNSLESLSFGHRDHAIDIFKTLTLVFSSLTVSSLISVIDSSDRDIYDIVRWVYKNIADRTGDVQKSLDVLSKMDTMIWKGMSDMFAPAFISEAVSSKKKQGFMKFKPPKRQVPVSVPGVHMSSAKASSDYLLRNIITRLSG